MRHFHEADPAEVDGRTGHTDGPSDELQAEAERITHRYADFEPADDEADTYPSSDDADWLASVSREAT